MECPLCHAVNRNTAHFCNECGAKLARHSGHSRAARLPNPCPECRHAPPRGAKFCPECGTVLDRKALMPMSARKVLPTAVSPPVQAGSVKPVVASPASASKDAQPPQSARKEAAKGDEGMPGWLKVSLEAARDPAPGSLNARLATRAADSTAKAGPSTKPPSVVGPAAIPAPQATTPSASEPGNVAANGADTPERPLAVEPAIPTAKAADTPAATRMAPEKGAERPATQSPEPVARTGGTGSPAPDLPVPEPIAKAPATDTPAPLPAESAAVTKPAPAMNARHSEQAPSASETPANLFLRPELQETAANVVPFARPAETPVIGADDGVTPETNPESAVKLAHNATASPKASGRRWMPLAMAASVVALAIGLFSTMHQAELPNAPVTASQSVPPVAKAQGAPQAPLQLAVAAPAEAPKVHVADAVATGAVEATKAVVSPVEAAPPPVQKASQEPARTSAGKAGKLPSAKPTPESASQAKDKESRTATAQRRERRTIERPEQIILAAAPVAVPEPKPVDACEGLRGLRQVQCRACGPSGGSACEDAARTRYCQTRAGISSECPQQLVLTPY